MAEEKKTSTRGRKPRKKRATPAPKKEGFSLRNEVKGIIVIGVAILALLGFFGFDLGIVGEILTGIFRYGFGFGGIIPCIAVLWLGWRLLYQGKFMSITRRGLLITVFYLLAITMVPLYRVPVGDELATTALADQGGVVGGFLASFIRTMFGEVGSIIVVAVLMLCCGLLITRLSLGNGLRKAADKTQVGLDKAKEVAVEKVAVAKEVIEDWNEQRKEAAQRKAYDREKDMRYTDAAQNAVETLENRGVVAANDDYEVEPIDTHTPSSWKELAEPAWLHDHDEEHADIEEFDTDDSVEDDVHTTDESVPAEYSYQPTTIGPLETNHAAIASAVPGSGAAASSVSAGAGMSSMPLSVPSLASTAEDTAQVAVSKDGQIHRTYDRPYHFPSLDILAKGEVGQNNNDEVAYNAMRLEDVLSSFGISAKVVNATQGPTVTRYEIEPAQGVKVSRIVNLTDDIALNLAAQHIRMEAPIPGKSAIGIEVPNTKTEAVHLRDVLDCSDFKEARGGIPVGLGKDIAGKPVITDLAKMPHLLVAGTTGSGKSVCVNTLISSILFSRKPEEVKLLLIDPKMVELSVYNGIPHLMAPVVTDMKKAAAVLRS